MDKELESLERSLVTAKGYVVFLEEQIDRTKRILSKQICPFCLGYKKVQTLCCGHGHGSLGILRDCPMCTKTGSAQDKSTALHTTDEV